MNKKVDLTRLRKTVIVGLIFYWNVPTKNTDYENESSQQSKSYSSLLVFGRNLAHNFGTSRVMYNKTRTPQVGAISKAQKAQNIFFGKKLEIFEKKILPENVAQCRKM